MAITGIGVWEARTFMVALLVWWRFSICVLVWTIVTNQLLSSLPEISNCYVCIQEKLSVTSFAESQLFRVLLLSQQSSIAKISVSDFSYFMILISALVGATGCLFGNAFLVSLIDFLSRKNWSDMEICENMTWCYMNGNRSRPVS